MVYFSPSTVGSKKDDAIHFLFVIPHVHFHFCPRFCDCDLTKKIIFKWLNSINFCCRHDIVNYVFLETLMKFVFWLLLTSLFVFDLCGPIKLKLELDTVKLSSINEMLFVLDHSELWSPKGQVSCYRNVTNDVNPNPRNYQIRRKLFCTLWYVFWLQSKSSKIGNLTVENF